MQRRSHVFNPCSVFDVFHDHDASLAMFGLAHRSTVKWCMIIVKAGTGDTESAGTNWNTLPAWHFALLIPCNEGPTCWIGSRNLHRRRCWPWPVYTKALSWFQYFALLPTIVPLEQESTARVHRNSSECHNDGNCSNMLIWFQISRHWTNRLDAVQKKK